MTDHGTPLDEIFENDPFGLLEVRERRQSTTTEIDRLIQSFEEISAFYDEHGREPQDTGAEFHLRARLDGIRESADKVRILDEHDRHGLLVGHEVKPPESIDELLESDELGILDEDVDELFELKNVRAAPTKPDYVARRRPCRDFEEFAPLFEQCQAELDSGERYTMSFSREQGMAVGDFYILRGLLTYIADKYDPVMKDGEPNFRLRCIFSNGTESDLLMLSLARDLYRHGRRVSRPGEARLGLEDATGFIYVLRSLSGNPEIRERRDLYKIGFSRRDVQSRIQGAENDPTYLMAPVRLVETYEVNVNVSKLEHLLHVFFADARFEIEVVDEDESVHVTKEWFELPLNLVGDAVQLLATGEILNYKYDAGRQAIVER